MPECAYPREPQALFPLAHLPRDWYRQDDPELFKSTYLKAVGGTTWHWLGTCLRYLPNDFRLRSLHGAGVDWPLDYAQLEPFYIPVCPVQAKYNATVHLARAQHGLGLRAGLQPHRDPAPAAALARPRRARGRGQPLQPGATQPDGPPTGAPVSTADAFIRQGLRGKALDEAIAGHAARQVRLASLVEQDPAADNRVTLDPQQRDVPGIPLPRIRYAHSEYVRKGLAAAPNLSY